MLDEDFAVEVGHGDVVAVGHDEDFLAGEPSVDFVADSGEQEGSGSVERHDAGALWKGFRRRRRPAWLRGDGE